MKPAAPVLTVIVPAFNMESYLSACLGSLGLQASSMDSLDVIVVNDGSQDRTGEIAHAFAQRSPGAVRIIDKQNGNYGSCINAALSVARGEYVKVLDADDAFDGDALAEFVEVVEPEFVFDEYRSLRIYYIHKALYVALAVNGEVEDVVCTIVVLAYLVA